MSKYSENFLYATKLLKNDKILLFRGLAKSANKAHDIAARRATEAGSSIDGYAILMPLPPGVATGTTVAINYVERVGSMLSRQEVGQLIVHHLTRAGLTPTWAGSVLLAITLPVEQVYEVKK